MTPLFCVRKRFGRQDGETWTRFIAWSKLTQLRELVSLDTMLCEDALEFKEEFWPHVADIEAITIVNFFYNDLPFLERETESIPDIRILAVLPNPPEPPPSLLDGGFKLLGFDLVEREGSVSALCNCGGFPESFDSGELSDVGLIADHGRAIEVQTSLRDNNPEDRHADCNVWAVYTRAFK